MGSPGPKGDGEFNRANFPPHEDPANHETGMAELYPERLQDQINDLYGHNKVMPRIAGTDYTKDSDEYQDTPESKSTFPYKY